MVENKSWADPELLVDYTLLPEHEKQKDRVIVLKAVEVWNMARWAADMEKTPREKKLLRINVAEEEGEEQEKKKKEEEGDYYFTTMMTEFSTSFYSI